MNPVFNQLIGVVDILVCILLKFKSSLIQFIKFIPDVTLNIQLIK